MTRTLWWLACLGACSSSSDGLSDAEYRDIAAIVGSGISTPARGGDLGTVGDGLLIARGSVPKGFTLGSDGAVTGERGGLTYRYDVMCLQPMANIARCDPPAQSAIVRVQWSGELAMSAFTGPIDRAAIWRLDNLATTMAIASGTSTLAAQQAVFPDRTYTVTASQDVMIFAEMPSKAMVGGAITATVVVDGTPVHAELSLADATLVLDGDHEFAIDLATGDIR
jgi:hypothetical protein